jgi:hypothetical protein
VSHERIVDQEMPVNLLDSDDCSCHHSLCCSRH